MKKYLVATLVAGAMAASSSFGTVTINFGAGNLWSNPGMTTPTPAGGLIVLLGLENGTWAGLGDLTTLFSNLTDSFTPAGVKLLSSKATDDVGQTGAAFVYNYSGAFAAGDELMVVFYPGLTLSATQPGLGATGFYFRSDAVADFSDISFIAPADGGTYSLYTYTIDTGYGSYPNGQFAAGAGSPAANGSIPEGSYYGGGFTTVPEPSTYALLAISALGFGGYVIRRRHRA